MKHLALIFSLLIILSSCKSNQNTANDREVAQTAPKMEIDGYTKVKVIDMRNLDGCGYLLETESGNQLQPFDGMPMGWEEEGKVFFIKYIETPEIAGICMRGKIVQVTAFQE